MSMQDDLVKLGKEIEAAKKSVSQLEGRKEEVMIRLKKDFGCDTIDSAEELLDVLSADIEAMDKSIEKDFAELKSKFSW